MVCVCRINYYIRLISTGLVNAFNLSEWAAFWPSRLSFAARFYSIEGRAKGRKCLEPSALCNVKSTLLFNACSARLALSAFGEIISLKCVSLSRRLAAIDWRVILGHDMARIYCQYRC